MFDGAVGSLLADSTEGADQETGDVTFDPDFRRTVRASSTDGNSKDAVDVTQDTFLDTFDGILAKVTTSSFLDASADDGTTGPSMAPRGISTLEVTFTTDEPVTMLLDGVLGAAVTGAPGSCSRVTLEVIPGPTFEASAGVGNASCAEGPEVVLDDEEIALDAGSYQLVLDARTAPDAVTSDGSPHADGSASWNLEILLCPNEFTDGDDAIVGTDGDDVLCGGDGDDLIDGGDGFDRIFGGDGADGIFGGPGQDRIEGGDGRDVLNGGPDQDSISGQGDNDVIAGGPGDVRDVIEGGPGVDTINGGGGNDVIYGAATGDPSGDLGDTIEGGPGDDRIYAGPGKDTVTGGANDDEIDGGPGADTIRGGAGSDTLRGQGGNDRLFGNQRKDTLMGGDDNDFLNACDGVRDVVVGGPGRHDEARADRVDTVKRSTETAKRCGASRAPRSAPVALRPGRLH
jgi:Ca2+-binding RTX toxin-like protein